MSDFTVTPEFDGMMMALFEMPDPETAFVSSLREQFVTTGAARAGKNINGRRIFSVNPRLAWGVIMGLALVVIVLLGTSPSIATALNRLLRYIPNAGSVEQSTTLRMLAESLKVQREDTVVSVEQLVAGGEKTVVVYRHVEPAVDYEQFVPPSEYKADRPALILPDGSRLEVKFGRRLPSDGNGILYALEFDSVPPDVMDLTLSLTRLAGLPPGAGPEDWEIPLKLKPAPEGTGYPVMEMPETVLPQPTPAAREPEAPVNIDESEISLEIENYVEVPDGYILEGSLRWTDPGISEFGVTPQTEFLRAANGNEVPWEVTAPVTLTIPEPQKYILAYKLTGKDFVWPLTLLVETVEVRKPANVEFQFEPGYDLAPDQTVELGIEFPIGENTLYVDSAQIQEGFGDMAILVFTMRADNPQVIGATLSDMENSTGGGGGGVPSIPEQGIFTSKIYYENGLPVMPITITVRDIALLVEGPWQVMWEPVANP